MPAAKEIELDGKRYVWNGKGWLDLKTFSTPPLAVIRRLNGIASSKFSDEGNSITDPSALMDRAKLARDNRQFSRAEGLLRRVLQAQPGNEAALAVLSSTLREQGRAQEALNVTEPNRRSNYAPLRTSRAAPMCDLERWEAARQEIGVALAISGGRPEAFAVVNRIKAVRPDLYPEF